MGQRLVTPMATLAAIAALFGLLISASGIAAQATPGAQGPEAEPEVPQAFPTHIHEGTCADIGEILFPLDDVNPVEASPASSPAPGIATPSIPEVVQDLGGTPVVVGTVVEVGAPLEDILAVTTVIDVHESEDELDNQIACGAISGSVDDGRILVIIEELGDSGYSGEAELLDNGDGTTSVVITLVQTGEVDATPPAASPTA